MSKEFEGREMLRNGTVTVHQHKGRRCCAVLLLFLLLCGAPLSKSSSWSMFISQPVARTADEKGRQVGVFFVMFLLSVHAKALQT